ncbi:STAS domain-containing protein [Streptomyces flavidovirens]|uniref:STAS domain-containing protein n=1 Tax=Streptomyces flavidovirens TaxID=67298 RepID=UPI0036C841D5
MRSRRPPSWSRSALRHCTWKCLESPFVDSSGLHLLLRLRRRKHTEAGRLVLSGLQEQPAACCT